MLRMERELLSRAAAFFAQEKGSNVHVLVGQAGFEPTTSSSRTKRATKLRHCPLWKRSAYCALEDEMPGVMR